MPGDSHSDSVGPRAYPGLRFVHVVLAAIVATAAVGLFWFVISYIPARRALERAERQYNLHALGQVILTCEQSLGRPPTTALELRPYLRDYPKVRHLLDDGEFVLRLDGLRSEDGLQRSDQVMGYDQRVRLAGIDVLMGDGRIAYLSSEELAERISQKKSGSGKVEPSN
jgi:hypothetical protein